MDCAQTREEFSALLDGELAPEVRAEVEAHLAGCSECLRQLDALKKVDTLYQALPVEHAPEGFEGRIRGVVQPRVVRFGRARHIRRAMWPMLAAAALFAVVCGVVLLQLRPALPGYQVAKTADLHRNAMVEAEELTERAVNDESSASAESPAALDAAVSGGGQVQGARAGDTGHFARQAPEMAVAVKAEEPRDESAPQPLPPLRDKDADTGSPTPQARTAMAPPPPSFQTRGLKALSEPDAAAEERIGHKRARGMSEGGKTKIQKAAGRLAATEGTGVSEGKEELVSRPASIYYSDVLEAPVGDREGGAVTPSPTSEPAELAFGASLREGNEATEKATPLLGGPFRKEAPPQGAAASPAPAKDAEGATKTLAGREFSLRDGVWIQKEYKAQVAVALARDSKTLASLLKKHPDLSPLKTWPKPVVFLVDKTWYRLSPPALQKP